MQGGDKLKDAFYTFQELAEKFNPTPLLLNGKVCDAQARACVCVRERRRVCMLCVCVSISLSLTHTHIHTHISCATNWDECRLLR